MVRSRNLNTAWLNQRPFHILGQYCENALWALNQIRDRVPPNSEYFAGKADAYQFLCDQRDFRRETT